MSKLARMAGIKSPSLISSDYEWAYFALNEGGGDGSGTGTTVSNDSRASTLPDFDADTAITTQWSARNGWWTNLGSSGIKEAASSNATQMDAVFEIGNGCMLIGVQCMMNTSASRESIIHIGGDATAQQYGVWIFKEASNRPAFIIRDEDDNQATTQFLGAASPVTADGSTDFNLFLLVDNRTGQKTATGYGQDATAITSDVSAGTSTDLSSLGSLPLSTAQGTPSVYIGMKGGTVPNRLNGEIRRIIVMNFGSDKPSNITDIINSLHRRGLVPGWDLP